MARPAATPLGKQVGTGLTMEDQGQPAMTRAVGDRHGDNQREQLVAGADTIIDIRNLGLVAGIELQPRADAPGARAMEVFHRCFDQGLLIRVTGDTIALSPPLIIEPAQIDEIVGRLRSVLSTTA